AVAAPLVHPIVMNRDLVPGCDLERQTSRRDFDVLVVDDRNAWNQVVHRVLSRSEQEPDTIFLQRPAERPVEIVHPHDGAARVETRVSQLLREVVALPRLAVVRSERGSAELVSAILWNHAHTATTGRGIGAESTGLKTEFLDGRIVEVRDRRSVAEQRV